MSVDGTQEPHAAHDEGPPVAATRARIARALAWSFAGSWGNQAISLGVFLVLARLLEPRDFGVYALAAVVLTLAQVFVDQGFSQALVQRRDLEREHLDAAFWTGLGFGALLASSTFACAGLLADLLNTDELAPVLRALSPLFLLTALSAVPQALLRRNLVFRTLALRSFAATVVGGVAGLTLAVLGFGVWSLVGQVVAEWVTAVAVLWGVTDWRPRFALSLAHLRDLWSFGTNVMGSSLLNFANRNADDLVVGALLGPVALGFYVVGYRVLRIMTRLLATGVSQVAFSSLSRLQHDPAKMRSAFHRGTDLAGLVAFPVFGALGALAPDVVDVVFGDQWGPSGRVMQILAAIGVLHAVFSLTDSVLLASGRPFVVLLLTLSNAIGNVAAFLIGVRWGINGVAAAYVIRGYLLSPLRLYAINRYAGIDLRRYFRGYAGPATATLCLIGVALAVRSWVGSELGQASALALALAAGGAAYLLMVRLLSPALMREAATLIRLAVGGAKA